MGRLLGTTISLYTYIYIFVAFFRILTRDFECDKKMEKNYLNASTLARVFLQAEPEGAGVLKMLFLISGSSFNMDIRLMTPGKIFSYHLVENLYSTFNGMS